MDASHVPHYSDPTPSQRPSWTELDPNVVLPTSATVPRALQNPGRNICVSGQPDSDATATLQLATESVVASGKFLFRLSFSLLTYTVYDLNVTATPSASNAREGVTAESPSAWPADTDLNLVKGSSRLMLSIQTEVVQAMIQQSIDGLLTPLLFEHAFPDLALSNSFVRDALITAAARYGPTAAAMHARLINDNNYILKIIPLVRNFNLVTTKLILLEAAC
jgi:hypothetical protein